MGCRITRSSPRISTGWLTTLESAGLPCKIEAVAGVGHDFDPQYEAALLRGLKYISAGRIE